ncbi:unannotated protein [freshwater metagenome]|uniref:Unannotated protein n=1 Tax=freshwater metagenome TaxID=449393 RepID=A0A6J7IIE6_9ZZZZ
MTETNHPQTEEDADAAANDEERAHTARQTARESSDYREQATDDQVDGEKDSSDDCANPWPRNHENSHDQGDEPHE